MLGNGHLAGSTKMPTMRQTTIQRIGLRIGPHIAQRTSQRTGWSIWQRHRLRIMPGKGPAIGKRKSPRTGRRKTARNSSGTG